MIEYEIRDAAGDLAAIHVRHEDSDGSKRFTWQRPDGALGLNGTPIAERPLYGIDKLGPDPIVVIVEGEKTRDALAAVEIPAVATVTGAASTPGRAALAELTGREVVLWPDNDDVGREHMRRVETELSKAGVASVAWIDWPDAPAHGDAADLVAAGGTRDDVEVLIRDARKAEPNRLAGVQWVATPTVLSWADLMAEPTTPPPTIRPGIPEVGVTVLAGSPKAGKTLWTSQMALESRRPVLLVIEEGALAAISYRLRRQANELGMESPPITLMHRQRVRLDDRASVARLREYVAETRPALIILDPLNRLHTADENKPSQMTPVMDALAELAYEEGGRAIVAVHHVNKPSADRRGDIWDRLRGASSIRSGTDANLILDGDKGAYRKLVGEFRDAEPLIEHIELDRESLMFRAIDAPEAPVKVDPIALRLFVQEQLQVTVAVVAGQFGVSSNTARSALRAIGCDEYAGARGRLTFTLATAQ